MTVVVCVLTPQVPGWLGGPGDQNDGLPVPIRVDLIDGDYGTRSRQVPGFLPVRIGRQWW